LPRVKRKGFASARAHAVLLADRRRTESYRRAIRRNVRPGDVVLDLGCGTGVLSFFAARAGARRVLAVDSAPILGLAKEIARANGLEKVVTFHHADFFRFKMRGKADVLVHEQIGEFLWNEGLLAKLALARRRFLKPGGKILPRAIDLWAAPVAHQSVEERAVGAWRKPRYGLNFRPLAAALMKEQANIFFAPRTVGLTSARDLLAPARRLHRTDLTRDGKIPRELKARFRIAKSAVLRGLLGYFRVWMDQTLSFTTAPARTNTHWGQIFIPSPTAIKVKPGDRLALSLSPSEDPRHWRAAFRVL